MSIKRVLSLLPILLFSAFVQAQQPDQMPKYATYSVERGEDWTSISRKFHTSEDALRKLNSEVDYLFVGTELKVPVVECREDHEHHTGNATVVSQPGFSNELDAAVSLMSVSNKKARKAFTKLIRKYPNKVPPTTYYYRAVCSFNCGKYRAAEKDLRRALNDGYFIGENRSRAEDLLQRTRQRRSQIHEQNASAWGKLFAAAAVTTATVVAAKQQSKQSTSYSAAGGGTSYSSTSSYSSSSGAVSSEVSTSVTPSSSSQSCPSLKVNLGKWYCNNTGKCGMCGGDGLMNDMFGNGPNSLKCTLCGGTGKCKYCNK